MEIEKIKISDLLEYKYNAKEHPQWQIEQIVASIKHFGFNDPIAIDENNTIIEGHGRLYALQEMGETEVDCIRLSHLDEEQKRAYILAHNKLTMNTDFDLDLLQLELDSIIDIDMSDFGFTIEEEVETLRDKINNNDYAGSLVDDFIIMPQTIFDTRQANWQNRKREWKSLGIKSEVGREEDLTFAKQLQSSTLGGTSIFDPVLCEVCYTWFTPHKGAKIIDPFAGGSVRGVVSEQLGYEYTGIDLRKEQIDANYLNAKEIGCDTDKINWVSDNSLNVDKHIDDETADLLFTCPPYFDLEVYSDNEGDISNMSYEEFCEVYSEILKKFANKLKDNRFAVVVISDVRDKKGFYRDLTGVTKRAFEESGVFFYNDIILVNVLGSGPLRARKQMNSGRKVIRAHQNVLVFYKGDPKEIKNEFEPIALLDKLVAEDEEETEE